MQFTVITDHSALKALKDKSLLTGRLLQRAEKLLEYDFDVIYWAGQEHVVPDFLSRIYLAEMSVSEDEEGDCKLALEIIRSIFHFKTGVVCLRGCIGHMQPFTDCQTICTYITTFFWSGIYKDVKNVCDSC